MNEQKTFYKKTETIKQIETRIEKYNYLIKEFNG